MVPYYQDSAVTIYHGRAEDVLPTLAGVDCIITDPPYPDYHAELYGYEDGLLDPLRILDCRQLIFWTAKEPFPLDYSAIHIWDKKTGCGSQYERIFERNGGTDYRTFRYYLINSTVAASYTGDIFTGHPSQKPIALIRQLITTLFKPTTILDPFMGSGTTLRAAKDLGLKAIGIDKDEHWCEESAKRMSQEVLQFAATGD